MARYILGLDLGPNSIGWAMLEADPETGEPVGFFDTSAAQHPPMGVRVFEAGLDNFDTAKEQSLNQARRTARSMRRNHARRNARKKQLRSLLTEAGLLPEDQNQLDALFRSDPYQLRAMALSQAVEPHELGRILLHICQRRGFKSNRKGGKAKDDEGILLEIGQLEKDIKEAGCKTLGQYLDKIARSGQGPDIARIRKRHTRRDMYEQEFEALISSQREFHPELLTPDLVEKIHETIFFQHPFEVTEERRNRAPARANLHRAPSVRPCPFEPGELCCPKGDWKAQQFRIFKEVANLRVSEHFGKERDLAPNEREAVLSLLSIKDKVKFDDLRKALFKLGLDPDARFNLERGDRKALLGNSVEHKLSVAFGKKKWADVADETKTALRWGIVHGEDQDLLVRQLCGAGLERDSAVKLAPWTPADGYLGYSLKAVENLLPHFEMGAGEYQAVKEAYPDRRVFDAMERLPPLSSPDLPQELENLTNPIVRRALVEVRKVINALLREHGLPQRIVVEMAREMKQGTEARKKYTKMISDREESRKEAAEHVAEFGGNPAYRDDINRWLFWKEQGEICLYTGRPIPASELFDGGEWEVDHILPRWRSLDDSQMNKVLVHRSANLDKGNRTPAEWLGPDSDRFREVIRRAQKQIDNGKKAEVPFPDAKIAKLKKLSLDEEAFALRQLNDTRYLTTLVVQYLGLLYPPELRTGEKAIQTCRGGLTAELRRQWGLNNILPPLYNADGNEVVSEKKDADGNPLKSRDDHRHHAIDAVVIALSTRRFLKRYQDYWKVKDSSKSGKDPDFPKPWAEIRADVRDHATSITVSHRVMRKLSGALHKETFYGPARDREGNLKVDSFVTRKDLSALSGSVVPNIRDEVIRHIITRRLEERGWDGQAKALPKGWHEPALCMPAGMPIRKVRIEKTIKNTAILKHRIAELGKNSHMEIVASKECDISGRSLKLWAAVIPAMEAARRIRKAKQPAVCKDQGNDKKFVCSLARKESVQALNPKTGEMVVCVIQNISGSDLLSNRFDLLIRDARDSRRADIGNKSPFQRIASFKVWNELMVKKIQVDPLGRIFPAND
ncbi:MAG: type II CRISPR RNA-guided endonuclease Cas9 [Candidatus Krumholzibacteriia bacterium]